MRHFKQLICRDCVHLVLFGIFGFIYWPNTALADPAIVSIPLTYIAPGTDTARVAVLAENVEGATSGQFLLRYSQAVFDSVIRVRRGSLIQQGFNFNYNGARPESLYVNFSSANPLTNGTGTLLTLEFRLNQGAAPGTASPLTFINFGMYDMEGVPFVTAYSGLAIIGSFWRGDLNQDLHIDIQDLIRQIDILADTNGPFTEMEQWAADLDADGHVTIADVQLLTVQLLDPVN